MAKVIRCVVCGQMFRPFLYKAVEEIPDSKYMCFTCLQLVEKEHYEEEDDEE